MKKFYYLVAGVLSMGMLASCSNEDEIAAGNENGQQANAYLQLTLTGADNMGSRTQVPEQPGTTGESQIVNARVLAYNASGAQVINQVVSNLESADNGTLQTQPIRIAPGTYTVYVIANPGNYNPGTDAMATSITNAQITGLTEAAMTEGTGYATDTHFIMFNACNGTDDTAGATITVTETNDYDNPATSAAPIKLDRLAAKITYAVSPDLDIDGATAQLDGLTNINFEGFKLLNANTATYLQQHWTENAPVSPTTSTNIDNMLITPSPATFYHQWSEYNTITKDGSEEYTEVTDEVQGVTFTTDALFCMENNTGAGTDGAGTNYLQGNTTGVLYKAHAVVTGSDNYAGAGCFYGYNGEYFATLAAIQAKYPGVFNAATGEDKLAAAQAELQACVAGTDGASVSDFRVKYLIRVYQNGVMYYTHYITDQNYVNDESEHYHAVMRNTIYGLTVQSVKNIGDDVPGGWNPDVDPEDPIEVPTYLAVQCEVNSWVLSNYDVTLQ